MPINRTTSSAKHKQLNQTSDTTAFVRDLAIAGCIVQAGTVKRVLVANLTATNCDAFLKAHQKDDLYFLGGVSPKTEKKRAKDEDIVKKNHWYIDFDIRSFYEKEHKQKLTDGEIKDIADGIIHSLNRHPRLSRWCYAVFTGNGLHIHFIGAQIQITSREFWREGVRCFLREAEQCVGIPPDFGCVNLARLSRFPGSHNHKRGGKKLVEIIAKQKKHFDLLLIEKRGEQSLESAKDEARRQAWRVPIDVPDGGDTLEAIQNIPIAQLVSKLMGWETDGRNFWSPGSKKQKACFVPRGENFIVHGGTDHLPADHVGYSPFTFVRTIQKLDAAQTFTWFEQEFAEIHTIAEKKREQRKKAAEAKKAEEFVERIMQVEPPEHPVDFNALKAVIVKHFVPLWTATEMALSVIAQLLILDISNPFALIFVDAPSAGKTIVINFLALCGLQDILTYHTDKFSPASFVSNAANVSRAQLEKIDLLPRIQYRLLCLRDMATVFSAKEDDLIANIGILTRVLDGEGLATDGGVHGHRSRTGDYLFMLLGGSTEIPRRVWQAMANQGPRLFFYGLHTQEQSEEELADILASETCRAKEQECRLTMQGFLRTLWTQHKQGIEWDKSKDQHRHRIVIARCAKLLARFRAIVDVEEDWTENGKEISYVPKPIELPTRLNQLLYNLARGHALIMGRTELADEDMRVVILLSLDSAPGRFRAKLLNELLRCDGRMSTGQIESLLDCSKFTARREMKILCAVGISKEVEHDDLSTEKDIRLKDEFRWFCSDECRSYLNTGADIPHPPPLGESPPVHGGSPSLPC